MSTTIFEKQGTNLTVKPQGRLDTATSPVLEREMHLADPCGAASQMKGTGLCESRNKRRISRTSRR